MKAFQKNIKTHFSTNAATVKAPVFLDSRHYGPIGLRPLARITGFMMAHNKRKKLDDLFQEFVNSTDTNAELLLHVAKPGMLGIDCSNHLDYVGVDRSYFDGWALELKSILGYEFAKWSGMQMKGLEL